MITKLKKDLKGAIGIGTLIVFIAMILVAAIAAAVIVSTVVSLKQQAEDISNTAQNQISNAIIIQHLEGTRTAPSSSSQLNNTIDYLKVQIALQAGSRPLDMSGVQIKFLSDQNYSILSLAQVVFTGVGADSMYLMEAQALANATSQFYSAEEVPGGQSNSGWDPYLSGNHTPTYFLKEGNVLNLWINLHPANAGNGINAQIPPGQDVTIQFIAFSGFGAFKQFTTPPSYGTDAVIDLTHR